MLRARVSRRILGVLGVPDVHDSAMHGVSYSLLSLDLPRHFI